MSLQSLIFIRVTQLIASQLFSCYSNNCMHANDKMENQVTPGSSPRSLGLSQWVNQANTIDPIQPWYVNKYNYLVS